MPGGWGEVGEIPSAMVEREVREESGYEVRVEKLGAVYEANRVPGAQMEFYHAYKLIFLCTIPEAKPVPAMRPRRWISLIRNISRRSRTTAPMDRC
jgi:ADP-ribose pyrophosphatase YjhB (NUDIX family)